MGAQAKIINMLLYDGTLGGVIRIEDSNWNAGELFSAPRDSVSDLLKTGACNKYGVYLLLSPNMVYVGQSSDLAKRLSQHMNGKDWWESAVIITTKDDSLNHSDIDYLENVLIDRALALKKLDCDNKKSGNPPKVDIFRKVFLGQYLDEALFLMQLIGIRVFAEEKSAAKKKRSKANAPKPSLNIVNASEEASQNLVSAVSPPTMTKAPSYPDPGLKIGAFVYAAMRSLEEAGLTFTPEQINDMCTAEWSKATFHTSHPFMKRYSPGVDLKGEDGRVRFKKDPYTFGTQQVLVTKEWFESQRKYFVAWFSNVGSIATIENGQASTISEKTAIPSLPDADLKVGTFVKTAMEQLSLSGFEFSDEDMSALCSDSSMKTVLGMQRNLPFFKLYDPSDKSGHIINGRPRFYAKPLVFGKYTVYLNSQIYETDKEPFISWYNKLSGPSV